MAQNQNTKIAYKAIAWFTSNAEITLAAGIHVYYGQTGLYKIGDGITKLSDLLWLGGGTVPSPSPIPSSCENIAGAGINQATATASTAKNIFITSGAANSGILCADAILNFENIITNKTSVSIYIYPVLGKRFLYKLTLMAINAPLLLGSTNTLALYCNTAGQMATR